MYGSSLSISLYLQKEEAHTSPIKDSSNEKKVTSRLMMALSKNAHTLAVCMFSLRQALGKQASTGIVPSYQAKRQRSKGGMHPWRTSRASSRSMANHNRLIGSTRNDSGDNMCRGVVGLSTPVKYMYAD
jgi:hypothetical protein